MLFPATSTLFFVVDAIVSACMRTHFLFSVVEPLRLFFLRYSNRSISYTTLHDIIAVFRVQCVVAKGRIL